MVNHPNRGQSQKPSVGRIVIYKQGDGDPHMEGYPNHPGTNGTKFHPAVITRVWSDTCVNLHVFFDANKSEPRCSCTELPDLPPNTEDVSGNGGWFWPPRV